MSLNLNYNNINENINIIKDVYVRNNLNISGTLDVNNSLVVNKFEGFTKMSIGNSCFI